MRIDSPRIDYCARDLLPRFDPPLQSDRWMEGKRREEILGALCPHRETNAFSRMEHLALGPCVEKRREWKSRFDSRASPTILILGIESVARSSLKVVHGCNDLAKAVRGERKGDESSKRIYSPPRSELRSQHADLHIISLFPAI